MSFFFGLRKIQDLISISVSLSLSSDYHKLVTQYESASAPLLHSSSSGNSNKYDNLKRLKPIGDELREVIRDMEVKGDQITILRDIVYSSVNYLTGGGTNTSQQQQPAVVPTQKIPPVTVTSTTTTTSDKPIQEPLISVKDHDWITRKPTSSSPSSSMSKSTNVTTARSRSQSPARAAASLSLLKSSFKVQTALRESIEKGRRL